MLNCLFAIMLSFFIYKILKIYYNVSTMKNFIYWLFVAISVFFVVAINLIFDFKFETVLNFFITFLFLILPSIVVGLILVNFIPKKWYRTDKKIYNERSYEKKLFNSIKIKSWKDYVPQLLKIDNINDAKKDNVDTKSAEYINFFISETCRSEFIHLFYIFSELFVLIVLFFIKTEWALKFGIAITIIWIIFHMMSVLIQRYNRPRLKIFLKRVEKNNKKIFEKN